MAARDGARPSLRGWSRDARDTARDGLEGGGGGWWLVGGWLLVVVVVVVVGVGETE